MATYQLQGTLLGICTLSMVASAVASELPTSANLQERFIVQLKDTEVATLQSSDIRAATINLLQSTASDVNAEMVRSLPSINAMAVVLDANQKQALESDPRVAFVEVDPKRYLHAESTPYGITMVQARQVSDSLTGNRKVCIMDTGYQRSHEDLISSGVTGNDGYGSNNTGNWYQDGNGHGTHVAGTIAALGGNSRGVVGVNSSGLLGLHIVKVFNDSGNWAYGSDLIGAVTQCQNAGANVISMSLGGGASSNAERQAFASAKAAGILSIAAAGNDGNSTMSYPASYDEVMSVAAVDSSGTVASFSQYNSQVEIAAPGVGVNSTYNDGGYKSLSGTSMATPHVAGVAALVWSHFTGCSNEQIRAALNATAEDKGSAGRDTKYGYGIVKAKAAYDYLQNSECGGGTTPDPKPVADFTASVNGNSVTLTNQSTDDDGINSSLWDLGDGNTSTQSSLTHTYVSSGAYQISLTVTDTANQTATVSKSIVVGDIVEPPCGGVSAWSASVNYQVGDRVSYSGKLYEATWWSTGARPDLFSNVWKVVGKCDGETPNQPPVAGFSASVNGLTVTFANSSTDDSGVVSHSWSFGDNAISSQANPVHTYPQAGTYNVELTVKDAQGLSDSLRMSVTVSDDSTTPPDGCVGLSNWSESAVYQSGDSVAYQGVKYTANWWSQGDNPASNSGPWSVWTNNGSCN
ncbi:S8 family serine peptidase [Shewanella corallii]|uniref:S8 family serine peptidase n=1 Tax=Shewanella corallii TaxID=560080 RepID=A0ABT0N9J6_9GAMM|nr:S8 family serine peptidase [Shewanella corallii]MCL2914521.1 S8 family serine peptidase [Shewanella corallii]